MWQLGLGLVDERGNAASVATLGQEVREKLIARMAEAILAVVDREGGESDEQRNDES